MAFDTPGARSAAYRDLVMRQIKLLSLLDDSAGGSQVPVDPEALRGRGQEIDSWQHKLHTHTHTHLSLAIKYMHISVWYK